MDDGPLILVVDDEPHIREVVCFALKKSGFRTIEARDGGEALRRFDADEPALVVLDILMPETDGRDVCRAIRAQSDVPIIFLSSRDEEVDRIVGLELGGDDYLTKPFSPRELVARVRAVLRRTSTSDRVPRKGPTDDSDSVLQHGRLRLDPERFRAWWDDREVDLTVTEFGIVRVLMAFPGKVYTRPELMERAYRDERVVSDRTIDSHVRRARHKFAEVGGDPIVTVHGLGYKLGPCG